MPWRAAGADEVRVLIARLVLGDQSDAAKLGEIDLHDHQLSALQRINDVLQRFNGCLLCDEVGMGKTYVAIAVARQFPGRIVVAPAALVPMWKGSLDRTESRADLVTFESLSRADLDSFRGNPGRQHRYDLVIVDEAHHVRNPRTNRYFALERLVRGAKVVLLSATPIHNRRDDLVALLSLFLGSRAKSMTSAELSQCVIRREQRQLEQSLAIPTVRRTISHTPGDDPGVVEALMNLPPPVPPRDGGVAVALVGRGLVRQWASSEAALREALRRRIARATALCVSLEAGTYPTTKELEQWVYDDGALQLGFAELLSAPTPDHAELLTTLRVHVTALQAVKQHFNSTALDTKRAEILNSIRDSNPARKAVAFSQYAETVAMLYRRLVKYGYVAMLTSHGANVAGGPLSRGEAIARFAPAATGSPRPSRAEEIHLLLTTDLLSEGVNLQDADTVVHLDIPWTAARMEQRVGRVARLGSAHNEVHVHVIRPPSSAATVLESEPTIERKWRIARAIENTPRKIEELRHLLREWEQRAAPPHVESPADSAFVAGVFADVDAFVAAVTLGGQTQLVVGDSSGSTTEIDAQLRICAVSTFAERAPSQRAVLSTVAAIERWCVIQRASAAAGVLDSRAQHRRELIARIDAAIESAPPQRRSSRLQLAARARAVVTSAQCASIERELAALVHATLPDEEWLAAIANLDTQQAIQSRSSDESRKIHAILILTAKRPRSPPPPDPGCP